MASRVESAQLSLYVHGTEDLDRVLAAASTTLGLRRDTFKLERLEGHFGNEIISCVDRLDGPEADALFERVMQKLSAADKDELAKTMRERLEDEVNLHVRLDKQGIVLGRVSLGETDPVKIKFRLGRAFVRAQGLLAVLKE